MLSVLNNYSHGYVTIPVILACKKHGLFKVLNLAKPLAFIDLVKKLRANSGHLRTALYMLESLNWVSRNSKDEYLLTPESDIHRKIPRDIMKLMSFPMDAYLNKNREKHSLRTWIELSGRQWDICDPLMAVFLDGLLVITMLLALKDNNLLTSPDNQKAPLFSNLNPEVREEITDFFINQGWLSQNNGHPVFTDTGYFIAEKIYITAIAASYRPMLARMSEVIFGDCQSVFKRDLSENELHIDRTLNIIGSGFQHEKYFSDMEEIILSLFNRQPYAKQPEYIADTGCGDGTLLKKVYEIIKNKSSRGNVLNEYPVKLIGIDFNNKALEETARTLKDIEHLTLKSDIGDPRQIIEDLKNIGIQDTDKILHIHSFLDHDRPYIEPQVIFAENARSDFPCQGVYVGKQGNAIPGNAVIHNLVEHLKRWSAVIGRHGLIILEVHCLEPETIRKFTDKCESLQFDASLFFSQHLLVKSDEFLIAAAEARLFPNQDFFRKYPKTLPFSRITLNLFEHREYRIRFAHAKDMPALQQLEKDCWARGLRASASVLKKRLKQHPGGQLVLEIKEKAVGVIYSQRIMSSEDLKTVSVENVERLHTEEGNTIQLLAINILHGMQGKSLGDHLLEFMLQYCSLMNGVESVVGVTRFKNYGRQNGQSLEEYIHFRNDQGTLSDPILRFHELHGAKIEGVIRNYRPEDTENKGCGVLISYDIHNRTRDELRFKNAPSGKFKPSQATHPCLEEFLETAIKSCLGKSDETAFSPGLPLMEMGLDSTNLLELNERISHEYQLELEPAFFFEYNTAAKILSYLGKYLNEEQAKAAESKTHWLPRCPAVQTPAKSILKIKTDTEIKTRDSINPHQDTAIIGMACQLPGGITTPENFWECLKTGKSVIREMPAGRWRWPSDIEPAGRHQGISQGGFMEAIDCFDALFFRISPKEVEYIDPQQRLLLELSWHTFENAGYPADAISNTKTGVFIGASGSDYSRLMDQAGITVDAHFATGGSMAMLANRISYFYDLHGPSLLVDTACSSSLVAVHKAVQSLQSEESSLALVGGVNLMCHPANSIAYYKAGMLAKDGKCKTFDQNADGYVRSEGAVMLLLKPLETAVSDRDRICAVIKGTACNHGGQASGLTVPNPEQQAKLLQEAWQTAGIHTETLGYIETHGTGTSLGDPIEVRGLKKAFSRVSPASDNHREETCGLGSVKTNMGHLEAAAGITGLLKVVLSLQHKELAASLHFDELNEHIQLSGTPFYITDRHKPWPEPEDQGPRRAGVSSFGSGGTNAHAVLEEYIEKPVIPSAGSYPLCFALSAMNQERLQAYARNLLAYLNTEKKDNFSMESFVYTLQRRQAMEERVAFLVCSISELKEKLAYLAQGMDKIEGCYKGNIREGGELAALFLENDDMSQVFENWILKREFRKVVQLWVKGVPVNWELLYNTKPGRITLPAYPFARERYWFSQKNTNFSHEFSNPPNHFIHPLLHRNTSDLSEQRFSSTFTGQEFFLQDHVVKGKKILPGVAYLEMARKAVNLASGILENVIIRLKNVTWIQPISLQDKAVQVFIGLFAQDNGEIACKVYSEPEKNDEKSVLYFQGNAELRSPSAAPSLNLTSLQAQCRQSNPDSSQCYNSFHKMQIDYGPGHRGINSLYVGSDQVLAKLFLPPSVSHTIDQYVLHPSLMDTALQAAILMASGISGASSNMASPRNPLMPFAMQEIEIFSSCVSEMWAWVRYSSGSMAGDRVQKFDIDLCDSQGLICSKMKGFSLRALAGDINTENYLPKNSSSPLTASLTGTFLLAPVWNPVPVEKIRLCHPRMSQLRL